MYLLISGPVKPKLASPSRELFLPECKWGDQGDLHF